MEKVPEAMVIAAPMEDPVYPFWGIIATAFYAGIFYWGIDQVNVQRVLAAPNLQQARWGAMFCRFSETVNITSLIAVLNSVSTLVVRDFVVEFCPKTSEKKQVLIGRFVILLVVLLGIGAAWLVYKNEEGLYKYLQTITAYLVIPVFPAIFFGIVSKKVTLKGATVSVIAGVILATIFVVDQFLGPETGKSVFPFLHYKYTLNFGFRGLWAEILVTGILFLVSAFTKKPIPEKLEKTTINFSGKIAKFAEISDWRLHLGILSVITVFLYVWLS